MQPAPLSQPSVPLYDQQYSPQHPQQIMPHAFSFPLPSALVVPIVLQVPSKHCIIGLCNPLISPKHLAPCTISNTTTSTRTRSTLSPMPSPPLCLCGAPQWRATICRPCLALETQLHSQLLQIQLLCQWLTSSLSCPCLVSCWAFLDSAVLGDPMFSHVGRFHNQPCWAFPYSDVLGAHIFTPCWVVPYCSRYHVFFALLTFCKVS